MSAKVTVTLAEILKSRREAQGMSLQDVADACGVSKAHIWDMEQGNTCNPSLQLAIRLSICLGIPVNALAAATLETK